MRTVSFAILATVCAATVAGSMSPASEPSRIATARKAANTAFPVVVSSPATGTVHGDRERYRGGLGDQPDDAFGSNAGGGYLDNDLWEGRRAQTCRLSAIGTLE